MKIPGCFMKLTVPTRVRLGARCRASMVLAAMWLIGSIGGVVQAQNYLTSTGIPAFAAPYPAEMGTVDASSGHLHLEIPLGSFPQRGGASPLNPKLYYDSPTWGVSSNGLYLR